MIFLENLICLHVVLHFGLVALWRGEREGGRGGEGGIPIIRILTAASEFVKMI